MSSIGALLYHLASTIKSQIIQHLRFVANYIAEGKLDNVQRIDAALAYLLSNVNKCDYDIVEFEEACGVGVVVSPEQIEEEVEKVIQAHKDEILEKR